MTRSSTGALKLLTMAGLLSADCDMCITGAEVEYMKFFVSLDAPFFLLVLWPLSSQVQQRDTSEFAQHFGNNIK